MHISILFLLATVANASAIITTSSDGVLRTIDYRIRAPRIKPTNGFEISHGIIESDSDISSDSTSDPEVVTTTSAGVTRTIDYRIRAPRIKPTDGFELSQDALLGIAETSDTEVITTTIGGVVQVINYDVQTNAFDSIAAGQDRFITSFI